LICVVVALNWLAVDLWSTLPNIDIGWHHVTTPIVFDATLLLLPQFDLFSPLLIISHFSTRPLSTPPASPPPSTVSPMCADTNERGVAWVSKLLFALSLTQLSNTLALTNHSPSFPNLKS